MITYAKLHHLTDSTFKKLHAEVAAYHFKVNYFFDWSRQWEYPWVLRYASFNKNDEVLDVGGGTSHFPSIVARRVKKVYVGDLYRGRMFKPSEENVEYLNVDITTFESTKKYDTVICISVLEHIDDYLKALENLTKLVKKQGQLVLTLDMFLDNTRPCKKDDIPRIIEIISKKYHIGEVDLSEKDIYEKIRLQEMKLDLPNLYSKNYKNRTSLGIIAIKK
jgi:ubiquinone/menaquinone biosynthesis C-methylase UbiE